MNKNFSFSFLFTRFAEAEGKAAVLEQWDSASWQKHKSKFVKFDNKFDKNLERSLSYVDSAMWSYWLLFHPTLLPEKFGFEKHNSSHNCYLLLLLFRLCVCTSYPETFLITGRSRQNNQNTSLTGLTNPDQRTLYLPQFILNEQMGFCCFFNVVSLIVSDPRLNFSITWLHVW